MMAAAVLTPRVRLMMVCDGVRESRTEAGVYHIKGMRQGIMASAFPFAPSRLRLLLLFSCTRPGVFPRYVLVVDDQSDKAVFYGKLTPPPAFEADDETLVNVMRLKCSFARPSRYTMQLWFFQEQGPDVLKGEIPLTVSQEGA
jgi:hypothetical protein